MNTGKIDTMKLVNTTSAAAAAAAATSTTTITTTVIIIGESAFGGVNVPCIYSCTMRQSSCAIQVSHLLSCLSLCLHVCLAILIAVLVALQHV